MNLNCVALVGRLAPSGRHRHEVIEPDACPRAAHE
jgi:hypothetical protein